MMCMRGHLRSPSPPFHNITASPYRLTVTILPPRHHHTTIVSISLFGFIFLSTHVLGRNKTVVMSTIILPTWNHRTASHQHSKTTSPPHHHYVYLVPHYHHANHTVTTLPNHHRLTTHSYHTITGLYRHNIASYSSSLISP